MFDIGPRKNSREKLVVLIYAIDYSSQLQFITKLSLRIRTILHKLTLTNDIVTIFFNENFVES